MIDTIAFSETEQSCVVSIKKDGTNMRVKTDNSMSSHTIQAIDPLLAFKMGLVSLVKFGVLDEFLKWVRV